MSFITTKEAQVAGLRSQLEDAIAHREWLSNRVAYTNCEVMRPTNALMDAERQLLEAQS